LRVVAAAPAGRRDNAPQRESAASGASPPARGLAVGDALVLGSD
jgi:hypothetical protein